MIEQVISEARGIGTVVTDEDDVQHPNRVSEIRWHRGILQLPISNDGLLERILTRVHLPKLTWLRWHKCPYSSLPSWMPMENLRVLEVYGGLWTSLWEGEWQVLGNLLS